MTPVAISDVRSFLLLGLSILAAAGQCAAQNLLKNGSFEDGPGLAGGPNLPLEPGSGVIPGWIVIKGQIDYTGPDWIPADGDRSIDLDGSPGFGGIAQTFPTTPGTTYEVSFMLSGNPVVGPGLKRMRVSAAGESKDYSFNVQGHDTTQMGWAPNSWTFTANDTESTLQFCSLDTEGGWGGPVIDKIVVVAATPPYSAAVTQSGPHCILLRVSHQAPVRGGELGLAYDPEKVTPLKVVPGPDFPPGGDLRVRLDSPVGCHPDAGVKAGLTIAWLNSVSEFPTTPPGTHAIIKICFALAEGAQVGDCSNLLFVSCLGPQEAPIRNIVTDASGNSVTLSTADGIVCIQEELPFRRGDANGDGHFDVSDPISVLGCLFLGTDCAVCPDSSDANDDGLINIADPAYLLNWRFLGGSGPPPPFPGCGSDPTADDLDECEATPSC